MVTGNLVWYDSFKNLCLTLRMWMQILMKLSEIILQKWLVGVGKMETNFLRQFSIGNRFEKVFKNINLDIWICRRNHSILIWNRFYFGRVKKTLSR